jgi:hypothetical protein
MAVIAVDRAREQRVRAIENSLASVRLEGLEPSAEAKAIFQRYIDGELTPQEKALAFQDFLDREYGPVCLPRNERP